MSISACSIAESELDCTIFIKCLLFVKCVRNLVTMNAHCGTVHNRLISLVFAA